MLVLLVYALCVCWLIYSWWIRPYSYWKDRGIPYIEASFPFGSCKNLALITDYHGYLYQNLYHKIGDKSYFGYIVFRRPHLMLKDAEMIKNVLQKDFEYFTDRPNVDYVKEPLSHHLFNIGGDKWKTLRIKMTPTFTSGKLKLMFPLFEMCSRSLEELLFKMSSTQKEIDVKDVMDRYTTKIIGTCVYGLDVDSLSDEDTEFVKAVKKLNLHHYPRYGRIFSYIQSTFPGIERLIKLQFSKKSEELFLRDIVSETMAYRTKSNVKRNDFIDLIMEIRDQDDISVERIGHQGDPTMKTSTKITDFNLISQVYIFFVAGFETSSSTLSFCLYELAENQAIQEKLRQEILANQPITYQSIHEMTYLDMVINETLRKYPTLNFLGRKCTKNYKMPDGSILEKDIRIVIPVYSLHHDPKYFPNPDKFDPERFSQANKETRPQFCYLPFGEGPRVCIGKRFGMLQTKMGISTILSKFRVEPTPTTVRPITFLPSPAFNRLRHPIKLSFKPLNSE